MKSGLHKKRIKRLLTKLNFEQTHGSSLWHRKEVSVYFGRNGGKTTFSMHRMNPVNFVSFNLEDMELSNILEYLGNIDDSIKQEIRKTQLSDILDVI